MTHRRIKPDTTKLIRLWPDASPLNTDEEALPEHLAAHVREALQRLHDWAQGQGRTIRFGLAVAEVEAPGELPHADDGSTNYTGGVCPHCRNATLVPNGTCEVCLTCGETTGCG